MSLQTLPSFEYGAFLNKAPPFHLKDKTFLICFDGYISDTLQSEVILNSNGELAWDPPILRCGLRDLPPIQNGRFVSEKGAPYYKEDTIQVQCHRGYENVQSVIQVIEKEDELTWNLLQNPCILLQTDTTPDVVNGTFTLSTHPKGPHFKGTVATIQCHENYGTLQHTSELMLDIPTNTLVWWPPKIECYRTQCPLPPLPPVGGQIYGTGRKLNDSIQYECPPDYELLGKWKGSLQPVTNPYFLCHPRGEWDPELPEEFQCQPVHCPLLPFLEDGLLNYSRQEGGTATYECFNKSVPKVTRTCQADRTWSGQAPTCPPAPVPRSHVAWILSILLLICVICFAIAFVR